MCVESVGWQVVVFVSEERSSGSGSRDVVLGVLDVSV